MTCNASGMTYNTGGTTGNAIGMTATLVARPATPRNAGGTPRNAIGRGAKNSWHVAECALPLFRSLSFCCRSLFSGGTCNALWGSSGLQCPRSQPKIETCNAGDTPRNAIGRGTTNPWASAENPSRGDEHLARTPNFGGGGEPLGIGGEPQPVRRTPGTDVKRQLGRRTPGMDAKRRWGQRKPGGDYWVFSAKTVSL